jgi:hypothetical protein
MFAGVAREFVPDDSTNCFAAMGASAAISAQMQGVPSWQKPQGSGIDREAEDIGFEVASGRGL